MVRLVTVVETAVFARRADKLFTTDERDELVAFLATNPSAGDLIEGTGGVRKVRFAAQGKGKSGGSGSFTILSPRMVRSTRCCSTPSPSRPT